MAELSAPTKLTKEKDRILFNRLGLDQGDSVHEFPEDAGPKYKYYWYQNLFPARTLCAMHTFLWLAIVSLRKVWQSRRQNPQYQGPVLDDKMFVQFLAKVQEVDWVHRRMSIKQTQAKLESIYSEGHLSVQIKLEKIRGDFDHLERELQDFLKGFRLSPDFLKRIQPASLSAFIEEVQQERQRTKTLLLNMVRCQFTKSVKVPNAGQRARCMAEGVREIVRLAVRPLPCLTVQHQPQATRSPSRHGTSATDQTVDRVADIMASLPPEYVIPELCALVFGSRRSEFLKEVVRSLLNEGNCPKDLKKCVTEDTLQNRQSYLGFRFFQEIQLKVLKLLGRLQTQNLMEVMCASSILLESVLSREEQVEIALLMRDRLDGLYLLHEACRLPGPEVAGDVVGECREVTTRVDRLIHGEGLDEIALRSPSARFEAMGLGDDQRSFSGALPSCILQ